MFITLIVLTANARNNIDWNDIVLDDNKEMFDQQCEYHAMFRCHASKCSQIGESWKNYLTIVSNGKLIFKTPMSGVTGNVNVLAILWAQDKHYCDLVREEASVSLCSLQILGHRDP
jgi:hypothetical protein